jgi:hypothetical protein
MDSTMKPANDERGGRRQTPGHKQRMARLEGVSMWDSTESAAAKLDTTAHMLRQRLRRRARMEGDVLVARLGGGIIGIKSDGRWLVFVPSPEAFA